MTRAFAAISLPEAQRSALAALQLMLPLPRRVPEENLHLTLVFLGDLDDAGLEAVHEAFCAVEGAPFELTLSGVGLFGGARPRVAWAGVAPSPELLALQARIAAAARRAGAEPDHRRYTPHVTLARFAPGAVEAPRLEHAVVQVADFRSGPFSVMDFVLYESRLSPKGAHHRALVHYPLGG
ncbi:RNA 2',3'-cyclic phosphodiesterase [Acidimangrovimonas pyrenivorans]|uniref:RNA 2',3'-cyclic phosphodiesterase n=1 Tax=Acidimangrovimonas pyrenivorans TaxID=2030798 RepID=A0ABV7AIM6_9RHOB